MGPKLYLIEATLAISVLLGIFVIYRTPDIRHKWPQFKIKSAPHVFSSTISPNNVEPITNETRRFALFASSIHSQVRSYIFYGPITAASWQRVGYKVIAVFVGDFNKNSNALQLNLTQTMLKRLGVHIVNLQCDIAYSIKLSQLVRMFGGFLSDSIVRDTDYILTSDSDIIPIYENDYKLKDATDGFIYNAFCCGSFKRREKNYQMYPMSHICVTKKTWRNILFESVQRQELLNASSSPSNDILLSDKAPFSFETMSLYTRHEFRQLYDSNMTKGDAAWFMDQAFSSMLLNDYLEKHTHMKIDKRHKKSERLDPNLSHLFWQPQRLKQFGDAHIMHDEIFDSNNWAGFKHLLHYMFNSSLVNEFDLYYKQFTITLREKPQYVA
ncbi:unnamed protein product [Rotaria magnacalcarata]|uniref:Nucleotide-diphospho-sugar transferase domain-containing protein n=3 Tax=Rotaria magnacalcarata TaxID=392030 RepID=A0A819CRR5_9BILA|nr:unnamed protein product [Rotaria magnacalcarata]CAF2148038.1 unnamed protein product [Rotaria magnacalcarata]CAF3823978.1 unnamed protein product [Rotaria magnacalcarata]